MGNRSSSNDWDSTDDSEGSDYEHKYNYHTSVLGKSPPDGFESDYEDDIDEPQLTRGRNRRVLPAQYAQTDDVNASSAVASSAVQINERGEGNSSHAGSVLEQNRDGLKKETPKNRFTPVAGGGGGDADTSCADQNDSSHGIRPRKEYRTVGNKSSMDQSVKGAADQSRTLQVGDASQSSARAGQQAAQAGRSTKAESDGRNIKSRGEGAGGMLGDAETVEENYQTAEEGSGGEERVSDDGSLSTITPPRTRPLSDSECTVSEKAPEESDSEEDSVEGEEEEEEKENDIQESDYDTERLPSSPTRSSLQHGEQTSWSRIPARSAHSPEEFSSPEPSHRGRRNPSRLRLSEEASSKANKRPPSPQLKEPSSKRSRLSDGISFSTRTTRYGIFDSESEADSTPISVGSSREGRKRAAPPSPPPFPSQIKLHDNQSLSTRTLRQAATQFVETSRKILQEARTAARILRESTSKRRSSLTLDPEEGPSRGKKQTPDKRETRKSSRTLEALRSERNRSLQLSLDSAATGTSRRGTVKRKLENSAFPHDRRKQQQTDSESPSSSEEEKDTSPRTRNASWKQVRKDGGQLRKFTSVSTAAVQMINTAAFQRFDTASSSSQPTRRSPRLPAFSNVNTSLPLLPSVRSDDNAAPLLSSEVHRLNKSFPSTAPNPFQNVTLQPAPKGSKPAGSSSDGPAGTDLSWPSPFSSLLTSAGHVDGPQHSLNLTAGSVWARMSSNASILLAQEQDLNHKSPTPGPSEMKMATRKSEVVVTSYPRNSTPRVPSLTLTGQFVHSGRFAFLLEDILQVTVISGTLATAATSAIVITTDSQLQHTNTVAHSIALMAGPEFPRVCQDYLQRNARGLQVCEVLDTPAGGQLSSPISHVLHVVVPNSESSSSRYGDNQHRRLLLCTYLNCLKHASEKLGLTSLAFPLIGSDICSADECIQVFFDSLLVYLAERKPTCPLHAVELLINSPALARFTAEVLDTRLLALKSAGIESAMAAVFREYFNIPDFSRNSGSSAAAPVFVSADRSPSGKPAMKRRRL